MARRDNDFKFEIEDFIGVLKESDKHDWCKTVAKIAWNDNPTTLDIRTMNIAQNRAGKGISLTDEETDHLVDLLVERDYGTLDTLEKAVKRKRSRFTISSVEDGIGDEPLYVTINL